MRLRRRELLAGSAATLVAGRLRGEIPGGYGEEAGRLTDLVHRTFWSVEARSYRALMPDPESVPSNPPYHHAYTLWPQIEMFHALVEGERRVSGRYATTIADLYAGLEAYFDPAEHRYCAWRMFPGNRDAYYDDNAMFAWALTKAASATGGQRYLDRAAELMGGFVRRGLAAGEPGGIPWCADESNPRSGDRNACTAGLAANAALALAAAGVSPDDQIAFATQLTDWAAENLQDADGLMLDGRSAPAWQANRAKWSYNTGLAMTARLALYQATGEPRHLSAAERLGVAAVNHGGALYDGLLGDSPANRLQDSGFFVAYLIDALRQLHRATGDPHPLDEAKRNADYAFAYLRDPADGLYWRNWRLWRIGAEQHATWQRLHRRAGPYEPDAAERSHAAEHRERPVAERPLLKSLLPNAGMARLFWVLAGW